MEYPVQTKRRKVLEYLHRRRRGGHLTLEYRRKKIVVGGSKHEVANEELGLDTYELWSLLHELKTEGYIEGRRGGGAPIPGAWHEYWSIDHLTDKGLREIGELPDPHFELMQRLDLAILHIQQDPRLSEPQKRQAINWLQEGTVIARTLTIDAIKAILVGAIL